MSLAGRCKHMLQGEDDDEGTVAKRILPSGFH